MKTLRVVHGNSTRLKCFLDDETGSAESALVVIPLLVTFLIGFQMAYVSHARNTARSEIQNEVSVRAIAGEIYTDDRIIPIESSGEGQNLELLVSTKSGSLINFLPNLIDVSGGVRGFELSGMAIVENSR